jgi:hypothetical protein
MTKKHKHGIPHIATTRERKATYLQVKRAYEGASIQTTATLQNLLKPSPSILASDVTLV